MRTIYTVLSLILVIGISCHQSESSQLEKVFQDTFIEFVQQKSQCNAQQNGIFASKVSEFVQAINRLRNMVATGNELNHKQSKDTAANMNYLAWSDGIARAAQNCAQRCPTYDDVCNAFAQNYGFVIYSRPNPSNNWDPKLIVNQWMTKEKTARQILWGRATQFGCGRSVNIDRLGTLGPIDFVVCFVNEKARDGMEPYVSGQPGGACQLGKNPQYFALCSTGYGAQLIFKPTELKDTIIQANEQDNLNKMKAQKKMVKKNKDKIKRKARQQNSKK